MAHLSDQRPRPLFPAEQRVCLKQGGGAGIVAGMICTEPGLRVYLVRLDRGGYAVFSEEALRAQEAAAHA